VTARRRATARCGRRRGCCGAARSLCARGHALHHPGTNAGSAGDAAGLARGGAAGGAISIKRCCGWTAPATPPRAPRVHARTPRRPSCGLWRGARRAGRRTKGALAARGRLARRACGTYARRRRLCARPAFRAPPRAACPRARAAGRAPGRQQPGLPAAAAGAARGASQATSPPCASQPRPAPAGGGGRARLERRGQGLLAKRGMRRAPA